ncbi:MAG: nitrogenase iron-molybdenum cofactor biosynthesis protein NifN [Nitrospiraceae bacterium]|nr:MAG: nitrogenase iron-molybdenum cofactor biosynthesis protein NifN [Nitrospiraceae bacterium]
MQSGCEQENKNKVCRSRGGESCAFDGAMIVLQPIADTAHIVHGPIACCGNSWEGRGSLSRKGMLDRMGFTTDISEIEIVYGAEEKLSCAIQETFDKVRPKAIFVHATCVSGLIGEDIEAVCTKAAADLGIRVIPVNAPGFVGPKNLGNRIAGEVLLDHVIGTGEPPPPFSSSLGKGGLRGVINLIGEYNIAGDLWLVEPVLNAAGINVLSKITGDASFEEITWAHRAKLNVVVCSRALINVAKEMERKYSIPYVEVSFFGKTEMSKALRRIAERLQEGGENIIDKIPLHPPFTKGDISPSLEKRGQGRFFQIESIIAREEKQLEEKLKIYSHLKGKKAVLYTGGVKSWSFISALIDLGIEVVAVGTKKSTFEDEEKMKEILGPDAPLIEDVTPANLRRLMKERNADMLIAGGRNLYLAVKEGFPFVDVNQERHIAYAGYEGLVNLAQQISNSVRFYNENRSYKSYKTYVDKSLGTSVVINPLKHSQSIGAAIALQGIDRALPIIHGAQGCTFLGKVLITKHFREPIALASTKLFTEDVVMGSEEALVKVTEGFIEKQTPGLIGVLSSGLSEVKGDDIQSAISNQRSAVNGINRQCHIVHIPTPDYEGGMETGYATAVEAVLRGILDKSRKEIRGQINVLAGLHLTPADFNELREIIESFGLCPVFLPDLSALDGSREGSSPLATGGVTVSEIGSMNSSMFTIAIGMSMEAPAKYLYGTYGIEYKLLESVAGLRGSDDLMITLSAISERPVPEKYVRQRRSLSDGMRDAHYYLSGKKICTALEPDMSVQTSAWLNEMAADVELAVIPCCSEAADRINSKRTIVSDLFSVNGDFDLLISSSHAADTADRLGVPLYQTGFPVYKVMGHTSKTTIGYRGSLAMINEVANVFLHERH